MTMRKKMRNSLWLMFLLMLVAMANSKPLVSFGAIYQQPQPFVPGPNPGPYYNHFYGGPYNSGTYYSSNRFGYGGYGGYGGYSSYGGLNVGIGALSLTPFLI